MTIISDVERNRTWLKGWLRGSICAPDPAEVDYYSECPFLDNRENEAGDSKLLNLYRDGTSLWRDWENRTLPVKELTEGEYNAL